jgi:hypothetical protein
MSAQVLACVYLSRAKKNGVPDEPDVLERCISASRVASDRHSATGLWKADLSTIGRSHHRVGARPPRRER